MFCPQWSCYLDMGFSFFHKITVLLYSGQALSDACSPCFSTLVMSWSGCHLSLYICTILDGSLFWGCTLKFCLYDIIWEGVLQACSHQVEEALFGIVLHLASARFIWWPEFLYWKRESASFSLSLSPLDDLRCPTLPLSPSCSPYPTYFSFNLGWRDPTYSVTACRNCCTYSVIPGALLWSFFVSTVPVFWDAGAQLHPVFKVWVEHELPVWYNDFLIPCSFPKNPEHTNCLFWLRSDIHGPYNTIQWRTHTDW